MARILIEGGAFSFQKTAANAKASMVLTGAAVQLGYAGDPGDLQAVLNFLGPKTVDWWQGLNRIYRDEVAKPGSYTRFED